MKKVVFLLLIFVFSINSFAKKEKKSYTVEELSWSPIIKQVHIEKNDTIYFDSLNLTKNLKDFKPKKNVYTYFHPGEKFYYELNWNGITGGYANIFIQPKTITYKGRECYVIKSVAWSAGKVDWIYSVRDTNFVYYDKELHIPLYFKKIINEGSYHRIREVFFDHPDSSCLYGKKLYRMSNNSQDILSVLFNVRAYILVPGQNIYINVVDDGSYYNLLAKIEKREKVNSIFGKINAIKVQPILKSDGIFRNKGTLKVWFTDNKEKIPVLMKSKVVIGSIYAKLIKYEK